MVSPTLILRSFFLFSYLTLTIYGFGQRTDPIYIVNCYRLNLREKPDNNAKILAVLEHGEILSQVDEDLVFENSEIVPWTKVSIRNHKGYVYSPYVRGEYMLYFEGGEVSKFPDVKYWYGAYYDSLSQTEFLRRVEVWAEESAESSFYYPLVLATNIPERSLFLLASDRELKDTSIGVFNYYFSGNYDRKLLIPGKQFYLAKEKDKNGRKVISGSIVVTANYDVFGDRVVESDFQIYIGKGDRENRNFDWQSIIGPLTEKYTSYALKYCGDIDQDGELDLIISSCQKGGCTMWLYLSSYKAKGEFIRPISSFTFYDQC